MRFRDGHHLLRIIGKIVSRRTIRAQISAAIHVVVQLNRLIDGRRRITSISELTGMAPGFAAALALGAAVLGPMLVISAARKRRMEEFTKQLPDALAGPSDALHAGDEPSGSDLLSRSDTDPRGIFKVFVPGSQRERTKIAQRMRQPGIHRRGKLPVKTSRVMAALMLPALLIITLTPVAIRWIRMFSEM